MFDEIFDEMRFYTSLIFKFTFVPTSSGFLKTKEKKDRGSAEAKIFAGHKDSPYNRWQ